MNESHREGSKRDYLEDWRLGSNVGVLGLGIAVWNLERMAVGQTAAPWPLTAAASEETRLVLGLAAVIMVANGVVFDGLMSFADRSKKVRTGVRQLRFLLASLPLAGFYTWGLWGWMIERRPDWAFQPDRPGKGAAGIWRNLLSQLQSRLLFYWLSVVAIMAVLWLLNILLLQMVGAWLLAAWPESSRPALYLGHGGLFAMSAVYLIVRRPLLRHKPWREVLSWLAALFWLAPVPFCAPGFMIFLLAEGREPSRLLTRQAFRPRLRLTLISSERGLETGTAVPHLLAGPARGAKRGAPPFVDERQLFLERLKMALLGLDSRSLAWAATWLGQQIPALSLPLRSLVALAIVGAFLLASLALMTLLLPPLRRWRLASYARSSALPHSILALGILIGLLLGLGQVRDAGTVLLYSGGLGALLIAMWAFLGRQDIALWRFVWVPVLLVGAMHGAALLWLPTGDRSAVVSLVIACWLAPVGHVTTAFWLGHWLIRPYVIRDIVDPRRSGSVRWLLLLCLIGTAVPFGGLLVPWWRFLRDRWRRDLDRELVSSLCHRPVGRDHHVTPRSAGASTTPGGTADSRSEQRDYFFRHAVSHLVETGSEDQLWNRLETRPLLADQARYFGGFQQVSDDLENRVVPAAIQARDWRRFARYSAVLLNQRRQADELAEEAMLEAVARSGQLALAIDAAGRLGDIAGRLRAWTIVGRCMLPGDRELATVLDRARTDLSALPEPGDASAESKILLPLADVFPALEDALLARLSDPVFHELRDRVRLAAALSSLRRSPDDVRDPEFWDRLGKVESTAVLLESLPEVLLHGEAVDVDPQAISERVATLPVADNDLLWHCRMAVLGRTAQKNFDRAWRCWQLWAVEPACAISRRMIVLAASMFQRCPIGELEELIVALDHAELNALLWFVVLQSSVTDERPESDFRALAARTRAAIDELPPNRRLAGLTEYLEALHGRMAEGRDDDLRRVRAIVHRARFAMDPEFLARYLVLIADLRPEILPRELMHAVSDSGSGRELLLSLARRPGPRSLLELLVTESNRYIPVLRLDLGASVELDQEILRRATASLCVLHCNLRPLEAALSRARDRDGLRVAVAEALVTGQHSELAATVIDQIRSSRLQQTTRWRTWRRPLGDGLELTPDTLYETLATTETIDDEIDGLTFLHAPSLPMETLAGACLKSVREPKRRIASLVRRMTQDQRSQIGPARREQRVVLELIEQALAENDDDIVLIGLTPILPALAAPRGFSRVADELLDGFRRLLVLRSAVWSERRWALEGLMRSMAVLYVGRSSRAKVVLRALAALLTEELMADSRAVELLPILVATAERFPRTVLRRLGHPRGIDRARGGWLPSHAGVGPDLSQQPVGTQILALCAASDAERHTFEAQLQRGGGGKPDLRVVEALVYLSSGQRPGATRGLIEILPSGRRRDDLCLRLIRHRWLAGDDARRILDCVEAPATRTEAELWLDEPRVEDWCRSLAKRVARGGIDPDDMRHDQWLRAVRAAPPEHLSVFAETTLEAVRRGGWRSGELALRLWMHAALGSRERYDESAQAIAEGLRDAHRL